MIDYVSRGHEDAEELIWSLALLLFCFWLLVIVKCMFNINMIEMIVVQVLYDMWTCRNEGVLYCPRSLSLSLDWMILVKWMYITCTCTRTCFNSWALSGSMYHTLFGWEVPLIPTQCYDQFSERQHVPHPNWVGGASHTGSEPWTILNRLKRCLVNQLYLLRRPNPLDNFVTRLGKGLVEKLGEPWEIL